MVSVSNLSHQIIRTYGKPPTYSTIQLWMYTWMRPNCESEEEYNLSKYLFESFLRSDEVVEVAGAENSMQPHESHYCFHLRKCVRHFDTHINSSHEGTNKEIKYGAAPCLPNYSIERAAKVLADHVLDPGVPPSSLLPNLIKNRSPILMNLFGACVSPATD